MNKVVEQILDACELENTTIFTYYDDIVLSFKKNILSTVTMVKGGFSVAYMRIYYSYGKPVCAVVNTQSSQTLVWWEFIESSTTYRGLYEFLNRTKIMEGKLNRNIIKELKQLENSVFVKEKTNEMGK